MNKIITCEECGIDYYSETIVPRESFRHVFPDIVKLEAELADKDRQLKDARAEIERLRGVIISQITPEPFVLSSYSATTEPAKDERDKLIEQMRKELKKHCDLCRCTFADICGSCETKAALSAAERGERK